MNKIMISIRPEWVAKILNGEKTIEIRKTKPSCILPCEVYIYCTKQEPILFREKLLDPPYYSKEYNLHLGETLKKYKSKRCPALNGKVVAKFTMKDAYDTCFNSGIDIPKACLTDEQICKYNSKYPKKFYLTNLYSWCIEDLEIFDKPMELKDFDIKRAPQSWCYIKG